MVGYSSPHLQMDL
uniref:Uncharacterized protein n=1 Tax=Vitis vinifera TaxID=29760 RepID=F6I3W6_VITVI